jgi:hypothetical protein
MEEFFTIATQCCEGLQAAHEKGIIHGDIKPENIMLAPGNRVKILDFGVARRAWSSNPDDATKSMETMTAAGGTPAYMAPEVLLQRPDDGRSDIFSLGLVFYEMLGGEQPFQSASLATTVARIVHVEPPPLKNVPAPLAGVISRSMAKDPEARYRHRCRAPGRPAPRAARRKAEARSNNSWIFPSVPHACRTGTCCRGVRSAAWLPLGAPVVPLIRPRHDFAIPARRITTN